MRGVPFLRGRELEEHAPAIAVGILREPAVQRAAGELVGVHVADAIESLRVGRRGSCHGANGTHSATRVLRSCAVRAAVPKSTETESVARSVPDLAQAQPVRRSDATCRRAIARAEDAEHVTRLDPSDTDVDERSDDRAHHLPAERGGADLVPEHAVAVVVPGRVEDRAAWSSHPRDPCGRSSRSRARRGTDRRRAGAGPGRAARAPTTRGGRGTDRPSRGSRSCTR